MLIKKRLMLKKLYSMFRILKRSKRKQTSPHRANWTKSYRPLISSKSKFRSRLRRKNSWTKIWKTHRNSSRALKIQSINQRMLLRSRSRNLTRLRRPWQIRQRRLRNRPKASTTWLNCLKKWTINSMSKSSSHSPIWPPISKPESTKWKIKSTFQCQMPVTWRQMRQTRQKRADH